MAGATMRPCGDFRTSYRADTTIFSDAFSRNSVIVGVGLLILAPWVLDAYWMNLFIQIGYLSIAALGLNILVGFTGQISIGHAVFFGFGAFASPFIHGQFALQTGEPVDYTAADVPPEVFEERMRAFGASGGRGLNVTVPLKELAYSFATRRGRAR